MTDNGEAAAVVSAIELEELRAKYEAACQRINELEDQIQCLNEQSQELKHKISSLETQELSSVHQELMW